MEIRSRNLLNQAENILKDRKGDNKSISSSDNSYKNNGVVSGTDSVFTRNVLETRMLSLQDNLTRIQSLFSKEQARLGYIEKGSKEEKSALKYDGESLFPEFKDNPGITESSLLEIIKKSMSSLTHDLKGTQVEMENLLALGFKDPKDFNVTQQDIDSVSGSMNHLTPERVAHLTRNSG
jgi:hypothetical protein